MINAISPALSTSQAATPKKMPIPSAIGKDGFAAGTSCLPASWRLLRTSRVMAEFPLIVGDEDLVFRLDANLQMAAGHNKKTFDGMMMVLQVVFAH
ncbi:MAG: hypothetical protein JNL84_07935 [Candidatus Accumulibacter sp.]|nr:hypothetical protein [Accumulibacter sp.]